MLGWWTVWGGVGGDDGGCEVEEGGGRGRSRPLDSRGDLMQTESGGGGGCESEG